jgi:3-methyladenine DNA glycosylase AlkD
MKPPSTVAAILASLRRQGSTRNRDGMARYGIVSPKVLGVSVATIRTMAKGAGRDHELARTLWKSGWYEARMMAAFVDEPARVTPAQMDRWAKDLDNWAICDTLCFHLFDKTPHAWGRINAWSRRREEFVSRAAFALLAGVALHDKKAPDAPFLRSLRLIERAATDDRNFVKKGVSWALRSIGHRNRTLHAASVATATTLAAAADASSRWVGKDALRDLLRPQVVQRVTGAA